MTENETWTFERLQKIQTDFEQKLSRHESRLMQNIETVMNSFEGRMKEARGEKGTGEKGVTRELESVNRMVTSLQRDIDKIRAAITETEQQQL